MSSALSAISSTFKATIGAWIIGATLSAGLVGIITLQTWIYYTRFPKDPLIWKILVALIWCLEVARTAICVYGGYYYSVEHWSDFPVLAEPVSWSLGAMVLLTAPIELLAHSFFAHQVRCVTTGKYRLLFYVIITFSVVGFAFGLASYIMAMQDGTFYGIVLGAPSHIAYVALGCAIISDWIITISLVSFLRNNQSTRTRTLMQTLILYTVNFGLLISLTDAVVIIVANVKWPGHSVNLYQVSIFEVVGNLYASTVLASLNSRTLVAAHLYQPGNLHFTSINLASTQIGFHHPGIQSTPDEDGYHVRTVGSIGVLQGSWMAEELGGRGADGESQFANSTESVNMNEHQNKVKHAHSELV